MICCRKQASAPGYKWRNRQRMGGGGRNKPVKESKPVTLLHFSPGVFSFVLYMSSLLFQICSLGFLLKAKQAVTCLPSDFMLSPSCHLLGGISYQCGAGWQALPSCKPHPPRKPGAAQTCPGSGTARGFSAPRRSCPRLEPWRPEAEGCWGRGVSLRLSRGLVCLAFGI